MGAHGRLQKMAERPRARAAQIIELCNARLNCALVPPPQPVSSVVPRQVDMARALASFTAGALLLASGSGRPVPVRGAPGTCA